MPSPMSLVVEALRVGASARGDSAGSPSFRRTYIALRNGLIGRGLDISAVESEPGSSGPAIRRTAIAIAAPPASMPTVIPAVSPCTTSAPSHNVDKIAPVTAVTIHAPTVTIATARPACRA